MVGSPYRARLGVVGLIVVMCGVVLLLAVDDRGSRKRVETTLSPRRTDGDQVPSRPEWPSVAICMAGGARSLPHTAPSIQRHLIDALGSANTHVFLETSTKHDCLANMNNAQMSKQCMEQFDEVRRWVDHRPNVARAFPNSTVTVHVENDFTCAHAFVRRHVCCTRDNGHAMNDFGHQFIWGMTQYMRRRLCFDRVRRHERAAGKKFDLVISTRPDMLFLEPVPTAEWFLSLQPRVYAMSKDDGWGDYVYIAPRALADELDRVFDETFTTPCKQPDFHRLTPPEARMGPLMAEGVPHLRWPFQTVIMRSAVRADCSRLRNGLNDLGRYASPDGSALEPVWQQCMRFLPGST